MPRTDLPLVVKAETGSTRTITRADFGALITNRGGGACTFTLPAPATAGAGVWVEFQSVAAGDFVIDTTAGNQIVAHNDATASSIAFSTDSNEIGNGAWMVSDGTSWLAFIHLADEAATVTIV
jgi:hypothetical protein